MREFVMSLLVVAAGDTRTIPKPLNIAENSALRYCLELAGNLPGYAKRATLGDWSFGGWFDSAHRTADFFVLGGQLLDAVDQRIRGRHPTLRRAPGDVPSSYDHPAFMALGQTLFRTAGVRRAGFPSIEQCLRVVAAAHPLDLQQRLLTNYLGNVLQDYFDAGQVRAEFASLPVETEETLRSGEATAIGSAVFASIDRTSGSEIRPADASTIQGELSRVIGRVWIAEKALDD